MASEYTWLIAGGKSLPLSLSEHSVCVCVWGGVRGPRRGTESTLNGMPAPFTLRSLIVVRG